MGDNNDGMLWLCVGITFILSVVFSFKAGQLHAESVLAAYKRELPAQMALLCEQCREIK